MGVGPQAGRVAGMELRAGPWVVRRRRRHTAGSGAGQQFLAQATVSPAAAHFALV